jgi:hypothetical protein
VDVAGVIVLAVPGSAGPVGDMPGTAGRITDPSWNVIPDCGGAVAPCSDPPPPPQFQGCSGVTTTYSLRTTLSANNVTSTETITGSYVPGQACPNRPQDECPWTITGSQVTTAGSAPPRIEDLGGIYATPLSYNAGPSGWPGATLGGWGCNTSGLVVSGEDGFTIIVPATPGNVGSGFTFTGQCSGCMCLAGTSNASGQLPRSDIVCCPAPCPDPTSPIPCWRPSARRCG